MKRFKDYIFEESDQIYNRISSKQAEEKKKEEEKKNLERKSVSDSLKLQSRVLGPGESWNDGMTTPRHDTALTIAAGLIPHGAPGSFGSPQKQMEVEKNWGTDVGLAFDVDSDGQLVADQAGMKALQTRRKQGKSVYFKKETPTDYIRKIFSGKGIESPYD